MVPNLGNVVIDCTDLDVPDIQAAGVHARELGAAPVREPQGHPQAPFQVWQDPEGNEFCLVTEK